MARILGLDLGSHAIKAVLIETTLRTAQPRLYVEAPRPEGERDATLGSALDALLTAHPGLRAEQVSVALPGPAVATHLLTLPFSDLKRIEAALPFEVESQLPFDLDEAVFDYQPASASEGKSDLLVGVVRRNELSALLEVLKTHGMDPRIVTHPAITYQNLLATLAFPTAGPGPIAIVDLGNERTCVAIGHAGGGLEFARVFTGGGRDLTRAVASALNLAPAAAEELKREQGALGVEPSTPTEGALQQALARGLSPIARELRATLKAHEARTHRPVTQLFICGGTAKLAGLGPHLAHELGLPVEPLRLPAEVSALLAPGVEPVAAQSYALALRGGVSAGAKAPRFNLRRGALAFKGDYDYLRGRLGRLGAYAAVLLALLIGSGIARNVTLARAEAEVDRILCETTQRVLGRCERNFQVALSMLRGKESPAAVLPKLSAVSLLAEVTSRLPTDVPIELKQVVINLDRISAKFETSNSQQIDKINAALKGHRCFREVKEGKVERTRDGQKVSFPLDIQVECPVDHLPQG